MEGLEAFWCQNIFCKEGFLYAPPVAVLKLIGRHWMWWLGREKRKGREVHNNNYHNNKYYNSNNINTCNGRVYNNVSIGSKEKGYIQSKKRSHCRWWGEPKECYPKNCNSDQYLGWLSMCVRDYHWL